VLLIAALLLQAEPPGPLVMGTLKLAGSHRDRCATAKTDEIVVCARKSDLRLPHQGPLPATARTLTHGLRSVGNARASVRGERRGVGGVTAPAAKVTVAIPF
jgi:hypothetical protein